MRSFANLFTFEEQEQGNWWRCKALVQLGNIAPGEEFLYAFIAPVDGQPQLYCAEHNGGTSIIALDIEVKQPNSGHVFDKNRACACGIGEREYHSSVDNKSRKCHLSGEQAGEVEGIKR